MKNANRIRRANIPQKKLVSLTDHSASASHPDGSSQGWALDCGIEYLKELLNTFYVNEMGK